MRPGFLALAVGLGLATVAAAGGKSSKTAITVWSGGGATYGTQGALVVERRDVDLTGNELHFDNVSPALDAASVQLRDLGGAQLDIVQQRFVAGGAGAPLALMLRHVGDPITVITAKGEVSGTLRGLDEANYAIQTKTGLEIVRREAAERLKIQSGEDLPRLAWKLANAKAGPHGVEVSYRTDGLDWTPHYVAYLDDGTADFLAFANIKNATGVKWTDAQVTLALGPQRFELPEPVTLEGEDDVMVKLAAPVRAAKAHPIVAIEASTDALMTNAADTGQDCTVTESPAGAIEPSLELDLPANAKLPDGHVAIYKRTKDRVEPIGEDDFHATPGHARLKLTGDLDLAFHRAATNCVWDDRAQTLKEHVEIAINAGAAPRELVVRDYLWRNATAKVEHESQHGSPLAGQQREWRTRVAANGKATISYDVVYSW